MTPLSGIKNFDVLGFVIRLTSDEETSFHKRFKPVGVKCDVKTFVEIWRKRYYLYLLTIDIFLLLLVTGNQGSKGIMLISLQTMT